MTHCRLKSPDEWSYRSRAALESVTKMVEDIAASESDVPLSLVDVLPPSCAYITCAALRHIRASEVKSDVWNATEQQLHTSLEKFRRRWGFMSPSDG